MRFLVFVVPCLISLGACGSDAPLERPTTARDCGELEGVEPVEPVVLGTDSFGCPVFAPVPCMKSTEDYRAICGTDCVPATALKANGDAWLVGCKTRGGAVFCGGPDYHEEICGIDPFKNEVYWWSVTECSAVFIYAAECWNSCDGSHGPTREDCL